MPDAAIVPDEEPEPEPVVLARRNDARAGMGRGHLNLATPSAHFDTQRLEPAQLAGRMSVPRTYVSKIGDEKATPTCLPWSGWRELWKVTVPNC